LNKSWIVFRPDQPGLIWGEIEADGSSDNPVLNRIVSDMRHGKFKAGAYDLLLVPNCKDENGNLNAKKKDCTKLGKEFAPKANRGSNSGLKSITPDKRYRGKVDWEAERPRIKSWFASGLTRGAIARRLSVRPSTLSEANNRYDLLPPGEPVA
jgi:DNA invertase Pin-like site-specific DNA recombinase